MHYTDDLNTCDGLLSHEQKHQLRHLFVATKENSNPVLERKPIAIGAHPHLDHILLSDPLKKLF